MTHNGESRPVDKSTEFGGILLTEGERCAVYEQAIADGLSDYEAREKAWPSVSPDLQRVEGGFDDDAVWADVGPWHCGLCAQDTDGCECGEPLVVIVRVPGLTPTETDHDLVAMSLVAMLNDSRVEQYGGPEGQGPTPIRLLASGWGNVPEVPDDPAQSGRTSTLDARQ